MKVLSYVKVLSHLTCINTDTPIKAAYLLQRHRKISLYFPKKFFDCLLYFRKFVIDLRLLGFSKYALD